MLKGNKVLGIFFLGVFAMCLVPSMVFASSYDDLVKSKEYTIKSIEPLNEDFAFALADIIYLEMEGKYDGWYIDFNNCIENYTRCKLTKYDVSQGNRLESDFYIKINYVYDKDIKKVVDSLKNNLDKDNYSLTDIDYFNWKIAYLTQLDDDASKGIYDEAEEPSMVMFSSEFKKNIGYKNFFVDLRLGDDFPLFTLRGGSGVFTYDDTIYYIASTPVLSSYDHLFYVNSNTVDVKKAIKERLEENSTHKFEVEDTGQTVEEFLIDEFKTWFTPNSYDQQYQNADDYAQAKLNELKNNPDNEYHYLADYLNEHVYIIGYDFQNVGIMDFVIPVKDSTKLTKSEFKSNDIGSDISISTNSLIPLDTLIKVAKLTNGDEYDKIVKILNTTNVEMYDLKLFSKSVGNYITKLSDGTFEVKIPIKEEFKNKDLIVYYVDDDNKITEYEVTVENGYAKFNTNHFSIYTLAEKNSTGSSTIIEENPKTYDGIVNNILVGIISLIGLAGITIYLKKRSNIKGY